MIPQQIRIPWTFFRTMVRERISSSFQIRIPKPEVVETSTQVLNFPNTEIDHGPLTALYLFNAYQVSRVIGSCARVIDLACGPAHQLIAIAKLNPGIQFTGVDSSQPLLSMAERNIRAAKVPNIRLVHSDVSRLKSIDRWAYDGVISTMSLHHLSTQEHLADCFREVHRILRPGGAIFFIDFSRFKSLRSIEDFVNIQEGESEMYLDELYNSMRAAFSPDEFTGAMNFLKHERPYLRYVRTQPVSLYQVAHSQRSEHLNNAQSAIWQDLLFALTPHRLSELKAISSIFRGDVGLDIDLNISPKVVAAA